MTLAISLEDETCDGCGEESLIWWDEDETEDVLEVYVRCRECDFWYPKEIVQKSEDTSGSALEEVARKIA